MTIAELKKKYPVVFGRDGGQQIIVSEIMGRLQAALEANASTRSVHNVACDILDRDFLFGAWGWCWDDCDEDLLRDIRGMIIHAYRAGKESR